MAVILMVHVDSYVQKERKGHNMVISAMTDIGIKRSVNQDRAVYKIETKNDEYPMKSLVYYVMEWVVILQVMLQVLL